MEDEVKCASCAETEGYGCSWLRDGIPPKGAKTKRLPSPVDGELLSYPVACPLYKPLKKRRRKSEEW